MGLVTAELGSQRLTANQEELAADTRCAFTSILHSQTSELELISFFCLGRPPVVLHFSGTKT